LLQPPLLLGAAHVICPAGTDVTEPAEPVEVTVNVTLVLVSQVFPDQPESHAHVNESTPSEHVPLFLQGLGLQSSILVSQVGPAQPALHEHA
jgi:hypothetical protein